MRGSLAVVAAVLLLAGRPAIAEGMPASTDGTDPKTWDPALDAVKSGAKNHKVIYEDQDIRVLSVTVEPGEVELAHHHQWPSVLVFVSLTGYENRDARGIEIPRTVVPGEKIEQPVVARLPPEAAHAVTNKGTTPLRLIRVEYKNGFPK
jgi:mannose-6-phosphate isomerase-like protein (cupin superfamily)